MNNLEIGSVTMFYDEKGSVIKERSFFKPTIDFLMAADIDLKSVGCSDDSQIVKANAEAIMASWFSKVNEIELADREEYEIQGNVMLCNKYPNGMIRNCVIKFVFVKR